MELYQKIEIEVIKFESTDVISSESDITLPELP